MVAPAGHRAAAGVADGILALTASSGELFPTFSEKSPVRSAEFASHRDSALLLPSFAIQDRAKPVGKRHTLRRRRFFPDFPFRI